MIDYILNSSDSLTSLLKNKGIRSWNELTIFIESLPYGRNLNRSDFELVLKEMKGTCSSKHALLKRIADINAIPDVQLVLGMYRMNGLNTPRIGSVLTENLLEYIPEAHCYLKINNRRYDLTSKESQIERIENDIIEEKIIRPEQVVEFKVEYHKEFLKSWIKKNKFNFDFDHIWRVRERCIEELSQP